MFILDRRYRSAVRWKQALVLLAASAVLAVSPLAAQGNTASQLAELASLTDKVRDADTRTRVDAFHKVWTIALASDSSEVKSRSLELMSEPLGSASDHIRMPAVYAVAEIATSTSDTQVKLKALDVLREPMIAAQLPIRSAVIDAVNEIVRSAKNAEVVSAALTLLGEPVRSGNNGVRIPAINAIVRAVEHSDTQRAYDQALDLLTAPLGSEAAIGGMEVRMMAVVAVERIGVEAPDIGTKSKAMALLQTQSGKGGWEPEARKRAAEASSRIQNSIKQRQ